MNEHEYLVHHGCAGHLGRFRAPDGTAFARGTAVVVRSRRGLELGQVLCPSYADGTTLPDPFVGEIVRPVTSDDQAANERSRELGRRLFDESQRLADALGVPLAPMDAEVLLDGRQALLHVVRLGTCDEGPLLAALGERFDLIVRLYDLATEPPVETANDDDHHGGCESCANGGCESCSTDGGQRGNCTSCSAGGAKELANYFAELRAQMEQRQRVSLL
jgi:hypothetical protein